MAQKDEFDNVLIGPDDDPHSLPEDMRLPAFENSELMVEIDRDEDSGMFAANLVVDMDVIGYLDGFASEEAIKKWFERYYPDKPNNVVTFRFIEGQ